MTNIGLIVINVHKITESGSVISSIRHEMDSNTNEIISRTYFSSRDINFNILRSDKLYLNYHHFEDSEMNLNCIRIIDNDFVTIPKPILNIPTMIRCQNCETNFPTKYQYQRHQCEFNAEKVMLKPEIDVKDEENVRVKYVCRICEKQFVSRSNLERHESSHEKNQENICEHCNKKFVSENRLRIHKENHCKKAGDISKFYRSDVAVWKCKKCHEVFSSVAIANYHIINCSEVEENDTDRSEESSELKILQNEMKSTHLVIEHDFSKDKVSPSENKNIERTLTEVLFQCEFCNRTYAETKHLLFHQNKHTTLKNYECSNCCSVFDSYATAVQHWLKKCSENVNVFFLPRLTYCEFCDRPFKSHELLYTHKIKKKHYTSKIHLSSKNNNFNDQEPSTLQTLSEKTVESKEVLNQLIEDVLKTLDVPINKIKNSQFGSQESQTSDDVPINKVKNSQFGSQESHTSDSQKSAQENVELDMVKEENIENCSPNTSKGEEVEEKKKRGRKRKWLQRSQFSRAKKCYNSVVQNGFKYQCERCVKVFVLVADLDAHREKEHASNFNCEECGQVLHSAKALLIHCRAHKSLKPYVCETCGRSYSQTSHLWQHMRFHQGIKPFACPHEGCEARYTIRPDLKDHIRKVHTRERPFKCNVCNKCFLTGSVYYQHRLIHTNDRRYACDLCPKRFFRADALNNHRRIHTDERPYPCHVCGREFRQKGDRNKHLRTQHPETIIA